MQGSGRSKRPFQEDEGEEEDEDKEEEEDEDEDEEVEKEGRKVGLKIFWRIFNFSFNFQKLFSFPLLRGNEPEIGHSHPIFCSAMPTGQVGIAFFIKRIHGSHNSLFFPLKIWQRKSHPASKRDK